MNKNQNNKKKNDNTNKDIVEKGSSEGTPGLLQSTSQADMSSSRREIGFDSTAVGLKASCDRWGFEPGITRVRGQCSIHWTCDNCKNMCKSFI